MFSNNIRTLYLYVVSFLALMAIILGTVNLVEKITNYIYPVDYIYSERYYTNDNELKGDYTLQDNTTNIDVQKQNTQRKTLKDIFTSVAIILVAVPLYNYHWVMSQKERKKEGV